MTPWFPLETERLLLRDFHLEDEADIYEYASDPQVVRFADGGPSDISTIRANLQHRLKDQESWPRDSIEVAVELRSNDRLIGIMRITVLDRTNRTADFGYTFNRRYWNNGYATEGTRALLHLAFSSLNLHRVWATCDVRNQVPLRSSGQGC
jgi:RimJ/RimL family protein N-acetyltransferase